MDLIYLLEELQTIARNGLTYTRDVYDKERYERLLELSTQQYSEILDLSSESVRERFSTELGHITPKVGADAAIFNEQGDILLMERTDGTGWCLPCGWLEPNEKPSTCAVREAWEETGLEVEIERLVGAFSRPASAATGVHAMVAIVFLYWSLDTVPKWSREHERKARAAQKIWSSETYIPAFSD